MLTTFRNLDDTKKRIVVAVAAAILIALLFVIGFFLRGESATEEPVSPPPYASNVATDTPTDGATATPTVTPEPISEPAPTGPGSDIIYGETTLSIEEQQSAQSVAKDGMLTYFQNAKDETLESKNSRLDAYFTRESGAYDEESISSSFGLPAPDANNYIISKGSIDYVDPAGGNTDVYKVVIGMTYRIQFNEEGKTPQILEKNGVYTLLLSKSSGAWKIVSLDPNK